MDDSILYKEFNIVTVEVGEFIKHELKLINILTELQKAKYTS